MKTGGGMDPGAAPRSGLECASSSRGATLVEVVVALLVLGVGLLAVAGVSTSVGAQARLSALQTDQALVAQQEMGRVLSLGWSSLLPGSVTDTVATGGRQWEVVRTVTEPAAELREVTVQVAPVDGSVRSRSFSTRLHEPRPLAE